MLKKYLARPFQFLVLAIALLWGSSVFVAHAADIKESAPSRYVVKKGDTLWDISGFYLDEPWRWPELWVKNTQIENPHLIFPGDVLVLSFVDGVPFLSIEKQKQKFVLSPESKRKDKSSAIDVLPWTLLEPYIGQSWVVSADDFIVLPKVLGNGEGSITFANNDVLLTKQSERSEDQLYITRNMGSIRDMEGNELGVQLNHVADAEVLIDELDSEWLVQVKNNKREVVQGDVLWNAPEYDRESLVLQPAENVTGHVIGGFDDHYLFGKFDVVIVDLGSDEVNPGSVLGIYAQGPDIVDKKKPKYVEKSDTVLRSLEEGETVSQPAIKMGELIVFSVFDSVSYGIITRSKKSIKRGFVVGKP